MLLTHAPSTEQPPSTSQAGAPGAGGAAGALVRRPRSSGSFEKRSDSLEAAEIPKASQRSQSKLLKEIATGRPMAGLACNFRARSLRMGGHQPGHTANLAISYSALSLCLCLSILGFAE